MRMSIIRCKLSKKKQSELLQFFAAEVTARTAADLIGINRRTAILYYHKIRQVIAAQLSQQAEEMLGGEIELDESPSQR